MITLSLINATLRNLKLIKNDTLNNIHFFMFNVLQKLSNGLTIILIY